MFYEQRMAVPGSPAELRAEYEGDLEVVVETHGPDTVATETGLDRDVVDALVAGDAPDLSLEDAAEIQSLAEGAPIRRPS